jgi:G:T/U-mismatch repair DNA glycosylase
MVRAAITGAIDYSRADPKNKFWRIKHRLVLGELERADDQKLLEYTHQHWCAYLSHGSLKESSFATAKKASIDALNGLQKLIFPWETTKEPDLKNSTIDTETARLIKLYRQTQAKQKNEQKPS